MSPSLHVSHALLAICVQALARGNSQIVQQVDTVLLAVAVQHHAQLALLINLQMVNQLMIAKHAYQDNIVELLV